MWSQGGKPELKVVFSGGSRDKAWQSASFLIRKYGACLVYHQGVQTSHGYNPQDDQKFFDLLSSDPVQLDIAIRAAEGVVEHLKDLRSSGTGPEEDPPTKLSALMIGALHASDNKWIEENSRRCYLNAYLDDMAQGFIILAKSFAKEKHYIERILEMFYMDGFKWLCLEDVSIILIRLTRAGYIK